MLFRTQGSLAALAMAFMAATAAPAGFAQTPPQTQQSDQDHKGHHPDGKAPSTQATPPSSNAPAGAMSGKMPGMADQGGMMCGDMKQMMSMMQDMHAMMKMQSGMGSGNADASIEKLKADLKITDAQVPQWSRFSEALRRFEASTSDAHKMMHASESTLPTRLSRLEETLAEHLRSVKALEEATQPLYAVLTSEQQKTLDSTKLKGMGMMQR